eukprot:8585530-Ditylum_brightwellii.AAC.1
MGNFIGRIDKEESGRDPSGLGRFSWHLLRGKGGVTIRVMPVYRPCIPNSKGTGTVYSQHLSYFHSIGCFQCPRNAIMEDIKEKVEKWLKKGDQIL